MGAREGAKKVRKKGFTRRRGGAERTRLARYAAFAVASGADPEMAGKARAGVAAHLDLRSPEDDAAVLREAGISEVTMFYAAHKHVTRGGGR